MAKFEKFANLPISTLNGTITSGALSLLVASAATFPTDGDFHIVVEDEIMRVTAVSGTTFTIVRAQEGTTAVAHSDGVEVRAAVTNESLRRRVMDYVPSASPLVMNSLTDISGNTLTASDFTWDNQNTATITDLSNGGLAFYNPSGFGANNAVALHKSAPGSTPWKVNMNMIPSATSFENGHAGIIVRNSGNGRIQTLSIASSPGRYLDIAGYSYTTSTNFSSSHFSRDRWPTSALNWLQIENDGTNLIYRHSLDGYFWQEVASETLASFITTADQVGFYTSNTSNESGMTIYHWSEE